jgi:hypothetical protein
MSITKEAYIYWSALKKNTDEIGGIFAPQPSEMYGNIHCISDPEAKVLGFISAGIVSTKRIFVPTADVGIYQSFPCTFLDINDAFDALNPPSFSKIYDLGFVFGELIDESLLITMPNPASWTLYVVNWIPIACVDCRMRGTKNKPSFWPNDHL